MSINQALFLIVLILSGASLSMSIFGAPWWVWMPLALIAGWFTPDVWKALS